MSRRVPAPRGRGFTLIELIVVILILGVLAGLAVVGYTQVTNRAAVTAAQSNLANVAKAVLAHHTAEQVPQLERAQVLASMDEMSVEVVDGLDAAQTWVLAGTNTAPGSEGDFAVGFDSGPGTTANDVAGTRAVVLTYAPGGTQARFIVHGGPDADAVDGRVGAVPDGATPTDVLGDPNLLDTDEPFTPPVGPAPTPAPTTPAPTPPPVVTAPGKPVVTAVRNGENLDVSWAADGATQYEVKTQLVERSKPAMDVLSAAKLSDGSTVTASLIQVTLWAPDGTRVWTSGEYGYADGPVAQSRFQNIVDVSVDSHDNIFVVEQARHTVRKITPQGMVSTVVGADGVPGFVNGQGTAARLNQPMGVVADAAGNLYITEQVNQAIRKVTPAGVVSTLVQGSPSTFGSAHAISPDGSGNFLFTSNNGWLMRVTPAGTVSRVGEAPLDSYGDRQGLRTLAVSSTGETFVSAEAGLYRVSPAGVFTLVADRAALTGGVQALSMVDDVLWVRLHTGEVMNASLSGAVRPFDAIDMTIVTVENYTDGPSSATSDSWRLFPSYSKATSVTVTFTVTAINSAGRSETVATFETLR